MSTINIPTGRLSSDETAFLARAAAYLENPHFLVRIADLAGKPVERLVARLPARGETLVRRAVEVSLTRALHAAVSTMPAAQARAGSVVEIDRAGSAARFWHQAATGATGAVGGFLGLQGLVLELPLTTTVMLRSIASVAQDFGEDLGTPASRMECLAVFSFGGPSRAADALDSSYYGLRAGLAMVLREAAEFAAVRSAAEIAEAVRRGAAPALARLVAAVAARFDLVVTEKMIAQAIPAVGALGGAVINVLFTEHFNTVARYHFGIRGLERRYHPQQIREAYRREAERSLRAAG